MSPNSILRQSLPPLRTQRSTGSLEAEIKQLQDVLRQRDTEIRTLENAFRSLHGASPRFENAVTPSHNNVNDQSRPPNTPSPGGIINRATPNDVFSTPAASIFAAEPDSASSTPGGYFVNQTIDRPNGDELANMDRVNDMMR